MGCDIHYHAERHNGLTWVKVKLDRQGDYHTDSLDMRSYGKFGFLADVRNYSGVPPIAQPRGFPPVASKEAASDFEEWGMDAHTPSWLTLDELLAFNYDAPVEDRRETRQLAPNLFSGGCTADPGKGTMTTWREFLGQGLIDYFQYMKDTGAERIVFWFDN